MRGAEPMADDAADGLAPANDRGEELAVFETSRWRRLVFLAVGRRSSSSASCSSTSLARYRAGDVDAIGNGRRSGPIDTGIGAIVTLGGGLVIAGAGVAERLRWRRLRFTSEGLVIERRRGGRLVAEQAAPWREVAGIVVEPPMFSRRHLLPKRVEVRVRHRASESLAVDRAAEAAAMDQALIREAMARAAEI
ncbi:hypothetical protein USB125703_01378 [Pseudoclavibacter triregionum]|nr:hypothetical protein USB125703_01378 [Pseudoclavibacter triregionum]